MLIEMTRLSTDTLSVSISLQIKPHLPQRQRLVTYDSFAWAFNTRDFAHDPPIYALVLSSFLPRFCSTSPDEYPDNGLSSKDGGRAKILNKFAIGCPK